MPARELGDEEARAAWATAAGCPAPADGPTRLMHGGEVVAIAEPRGAELQPVVVFGPR